MNSLVKEKLTAMQNAAINRAETLCQKLGIDYYIKDSLRAEMEKKK